MRRKLATLIVMAVIGLVLVACDSDPGDVPSLREIEDTQPVESATEAADSIRDVEAAMMAYTECLREQGVKVLDPVVDAEGNVQKPEFAEGAELKKKEWGPAWEACAEHLEGVTFGKKRTDVDDLIEMLDQSLALATCLREKGYDVDDPTAETIDQWMGAFKEVFDWKDPAAVADYEDCAGNAGMGGGEK